MDVKINIEGIRRIVKKSILIIAKNFFKDCLAIIFLTIIIALIFYYNYNKKLKEIELKSMNESFVLDKFNYEKVSKCWQGNQKKVEEINKKQYKDIFQLEKKENQE